MQKTSPKSFRDLIVWQKAIDLSVSIYAITEKFPTSETYGISSQMRRAAISISSNIAEGFTRNHGKEKVQFYHIAHASTAELESQLFVSEKLGFITKQNFEDILPRLIEVSKMTDGLIKTLSSCFSLLASQDAQALIEVLVAISVLTVGFVGVLTLLARSLGLNRVVADNYTATYLAAEGIEVVKNLLDHNAIMRANGSIACWNAGMSSGSFEVDSNATTLLPYVDPGRSILFDSATKLFNYATGDSTAFRREVTIITTPCVDDIVQVHAIVSWISRGGSYNVNLEDHFYNWR